MFFNLNFLHFLRFLYPCYDCSSKMNKSERKIHHFINSTFYICIKLVYYSCVGDYVFRIRYIEISTYYIHDECICNVVLFIFCFLLYFPTLIGYYSKAACTTQLPWETINLPVCEICSRRVCDKTRLPRGVGFHGGTLQHPPSPGILHTQVSSLEISLWGVVETPILCEWPVRL